MRIKLKWLYAAVALLGLAVMGMMSASLFISYSKVSYEAFVCGNGLGGSMLAWAVHHLVRLRQGR